MRLKKTVSIVQSILLLNLCSFTYPLGVYASNDSREPQANAASQTNEHSQTNETGNDLKSPRSKTLTMATPFAQEKIQSVPTVEKAPTAEKYLIEGKLRAGETALLAELQQHPVDDQVRFGLGTLQFLRAVEQMAQDLYRHGLRTSVNTDLDFIPLLHLPLPSNANPTSLSYPEEQKIVQTFLQNLATAEATLAKISDANVKLPLHFGLIRLDLNGDGRADECESLWQCYAGVNGQRNITADSARKFYICFDRGDVHWLRGYCHLLMSMCDVYLAHDSKETFDGTAHLFFARVDSPYKFLSRGKRVHQTGDLDVLDLVALIHLIRWPVVAPQHMTSALHHLEAVVAQSKESWKFIMAETDDDHEWLPNPKQTGVIPDVHVSKEMVDTWQEFMSECGKLLAGEVLIPFWRGDDGRGVNLRKVFTEPRTLDLVLWVQGTAAAPYLQNGPKTKPGLWRKMQETFGDHFPGFAIWFN